MYTSSCAQVSEEVSVSIVILRELPRSHNLNVHAKKEQPWLHKKVADNPTLLTNSSPFRKLAKRGRKNKVDDFNRWPDHPLQDLRRVHFYGWPTQTRRTYIYGRAPGRGRGRGRVGVGVLVPDLIFHQTFSIPWAQSISKTLNFLFTLMATSPPVTLSRSFSNIL